ncbi:MAG: DUF349 domain-containing protein [Chitinophagaceae bacterium]
MSETNKHLNDTHVDANEEALQNNLVHLEKKGDNEEHDEFADVEEEKRDQTDYSSFTKVDFLAKAEQLIDHPNIKEAHDIFKKIRVLFDDAVKAERVIQVKEWADAGNDVREFKPAYDELKEKFYKVYTTFLEKRAEEKRLAEEEKQKNLQAKKSIIEKLKALSSQDETESVFKEVLELQKQWKQIRTVPREHMQELWENYRYHLDKFYDNHAINNELKEKDRQKNLETKIDLIKKVTLLHEEKSIKKAHILLNKYHEEFKNAGPVPGKDVAEDIWKRFKEASDKVLGEKRGQLETIKAKRTENLELKKVLCEKVEHINQLPINSPKIWKEKGEEIAAIFAEWKTIGPVPESVNDQIWKRFREAQNAFNHAKKAFFDQLNSGKDKNLELKTALCEEAEKLSESTQFDATSKHLISLQEKWKSIGPVPENKNEQIWSRFRTACDKFFKRKEEFYKEKNAGEKDNLVAKEKIITTVNELINSDNSSEVFAQLKKLQQEWMSIGFVPIKVKADLQNRYSKSVDAVYKKFKQTADENKSLRVKEHYEMLSTSPNGDDKMRHEERIINDKLRMLREDAATLKNNIEFFAKSKNADALRKQIEQKIETANHQIAKLQEELKVLRSYRNNSGK